MAIIHLISRISLLLTLILTTDIATISGAPTTSEEFDRLIQTPIDTIDRFDDDDEYYLTYANHPTGRSYDSVDDLQRGYYFIDNGYITPVNGNEGFVVSGPADGQRRLDNFESADVDTDNLPDSVKYTPLVHLRETKTKHKKLFVPNLFG